MDECRKRNTVTEFQYFGEPIAMQITNPMDLIQRSHTSKRFFEELELFAIKAIFESGGNIIDAGSNIGNHTVFFSKYYAADRIYVFECNPDAVDILKKNLALNHCENVCLDYLGIGLSNSVHQGSIAQAYPENLGATSFKHDESGQISFKPIDAFGIENVKLLKVDCEGMDLMVIQGAEATIRRDRPVIFFECFNDQYQASLELLETMNYHVFHEFKYVNAVNLIATSKV